MIGILLGALTGFVGGVFYSRNKANPVQAILFDLKQGSRTIWRWTSYMGLNVVGRARTGRR